jgi:Domain of unknown function (DUF4342)
MSTPVDQSEETIEKVQPEVVPSEVITPDPASKDQKSGVEEFSINGDALVAKVKEIIHEGNIRRIFIKNEEGRTLIEIPLTVGVVGGVISAALFPVMAAVGAIGAMVAHLTIVVEKKE